MNSITWSNTDSVLLSEGPETNITNTPLSKLLCKLFLSVIKTISFVFQKNSRYISLVMISLPGEAMFHINQQTKFFKQYGKETISVVKRVKYLHVLDQIWNL